MSDTNPMCLSERVGVWIKILDKISLWTCCLVFYALALTSSFVESLNSHNSATLDL